jgi:Cys-rich repeat protein
MSKLLLALTVSAFTACTDDTLGSASRAILDQDCAADTDCPAGFECEIEVEHGVTTSFCQAHDEDGTCPAGYELEVEHGQEYCKPHGGDDDDQPGTGSGAACASDTDCPAGEECEIEIEHGTTTGTCQAHGGN